MKCNNKAAHKCTAIALAHAKLFILLRKNYEKIFHIFRDEQDPLFLSTVELKIDSIILIMNELSSGVKHWRFGMNFRDFVQFSMEKFDESKIFAMKTVYSWLIETK